LVIAPRIVTCWARQLRRPSSQRRGTQLPVGETRLNGDAHLSLASATPPAPFLQGAGLEGTPPTQAVGGNESRDGPNSVYPNGVQLRGIEGLLGSLCMQGKAQRRDPSPCRCCKLQRVPSPIGLRLSWHISALGPIDPSPTASYHFNCQYLTPRRNA